MGDARLNPRQLAAILSKLDVVTNHIAAVRGELIHSMAERRRAASTRTVAGHRPKRQPRRTKR